ncbi:MAG: ribbon-helix-helix protein, CopG family [Oscillospiraceae bacterium]|nr:ribbon-helix-helix protein, CopG family [Oscillospiraceae bacterium]
MGDTSWQVKQRYNRKVYRAIGVQLKKELVEEWEEAIKEDGISKSEFIRYAITQYLDNRKG